MINPYFMYVLSFFIVIIVYFFGWSTIYPEISMSMSLLLIITCIISCILGNKFRLKQKDRFEIIKESKFENYGFVFLIVGYIAEFLYQGGIPLFDKNINYIEFTGIPTFHVIIYTFNLFFAAYIFNLFICSKKIKFIMIYLITLLPSILLVSRGMLINIIITSFFIYAQYLLKNKIINKKIVLSIVAIGISGLYFFGVMGDYRSNVLNSSGYKNSDYILSVGEASDKFKKSKIPKPLFWGYLYISSPLANLQKNINEHKVIINDENLKKFIAVEIIPDFISKRIYKDYYEYANKDVKLIRNELVVGTMYMGAYYYLGFIGVALIFGYMIALIYLYMKFINKSQKYFVVANAMLCNVIVLNTFSNILSFSGMCFQLAFPLILYYGEKIIKYLKVRRT